MRSRENNPQISLRWVEIPIPHLWEIPPKSKNPAVFSPLSGLATLKTGITEVGKRFVLFSSFRSDDHEGTTN
jgi:hypothetical protein